MFSKALFKQSCKANGTMWAIITFAVCFMLACVMMISGSGNIGQTKDAIQDTIIQKEVESSFKRRNIKYYSDATDGLEKFDGYFTEEFKNAYAYYTQFTTWKEQIPVSKTPDTIGEWINNFPTPQNAISTTLYTNLQIQTWLDLMPKITDEDINGSETKYSIYINVWNNKYAPEESDVQKAISGSAYLCAINDLQAYIASESENRNYDEAAKTEYLGSVMFVLNPISDATTGAHMFDETYQKHGESMEYDVTSLALNVTNADFVSSKDRIEYREDCAEKCTAIFLADNFTKQENVDELVKALSSYGVSAEKYASFDYSYDKINQLVRTAAISYRYRYEYEVDSLGKDPAEVKKELDADIASSLLTSLPAEVSDALKEVGELDLYSLIVGSIFYKLAGLLLPIIYMIMASNNLISGQVDSGSMAYVLSTSTKRRTVVFTQAIYLIGSLLAMFCLTSITGSVCLALVLKDTPSIELTYGKLLLLNLGAFLVLFALSGLCFLTSCWFDRSKRSMAIGGGLSIYALVGAMLGLFGTQTIPSVVRLDALNNFNYTTIISLFDSISIIDGTTTFLWKFAILLVMGIAGYIIGSNKFVKKDLPL